MEYRNLGRSGLQVSVVGLGCNNFGMRADYAATEAVVRACLDSGINFFDTADIYGGAKSEEFLGKALGADRQDVIVASKCGVSMGEGPLMRGASRRYIMQAVEASLRLFVKTRGQSRIHRVRGTLEWEGSLEQMRRDRHES